VTPAAIARLWSPRTLCGLRSAFWTVVAALLLLTLTDWMGEALAVLIAGREAFLSSLPSRYGDAVYRTPAVRTNLLAGGLPSMDSRNR